jgi:hypothetical protein
MASAASRSASRRVQSARARVTAPAPSPPPVAGARRRSNREDAFQHRALEREKADALAARADGVEQAVRVGRDEHDRDVRGRLLDQLEQCVLRLFAHRVRVDKHENVVTRVERLGVGALDHGARARDADRGLLAEGGRSENVGALIFGSSRCR